MPTDSVQLTQDLKEAVQEQEQQLSAQLDRVYALVGDGVAAPLLQVEFKRTVERLTEKYQLLQQVLEVQKERLLPEEFTRRQEELQQQYKDDVVLLSQALDAAIAERDGEASKDTQPPENA